MLCCAELPGLALLWMPHSLRRVVTFFIIESKYTTFRSTAAWPLAGLIRLVNRMPLVHGFEIRLPRTTRVTTQVGTAIPS